GDLRRVLRDRVPVATVDAGPRREPPEPGSTAPAGQRQLARVGVALRDASPRGSDLRLPGWDLRTDPLLQRPSGIPRAVARRRHVRLLPPDDQRGLHPGAARAGRGGGGYGRG